MRKFLMVLMVLAAFGGAVFGQGVNVDSLYGVFSSSRGERRIQAANAILKYAHENEYTVTFYSHTTADDAAFVDATVWGAMGSYYLRVYIN